MLLAEPCLLPNSASAASRTVCGSRWTAAVFSVSEKRSSHHTHPLHTWPEPRVGAEDGPNGRPGTLWWWIPDAADPWPGAHPLLRMCGGSVPTALSLKDRVRKIPKHCVVLKFDGVGEDR